MKTIICAEFKQESNRYAKGVSGLKEYREREYLFGEQILREKFTGTRSELGGFFDVLNQEPECMLVPVLGLNASPGPVTAQSIWQQVADVLLQVIEEKILLTVSCWHSMEPWSRRKWKMARVNCCSGFVKR